MLLSSSPRLLIRIIWGPTPAACSTGFRENPTWAARRSSSTEGVRFVMAWTGPWVLAASATRASTAPGLPPASISPGLFVPEPTHR